MCDWPRCCLPGVIAEFHAKAGHLDDPSTKCRLPAIKSSQADTIPIIWGEASLFNYSPLFVSVFPIGGEEHVSSYVVPLIVGGAGLLTCLTEVEAAPEGYFCENPVEKTWSEA